jgi:hypothetical protein
MGVKHVPVMTETFSSTLISKGAICELSSYSVENARLEYDDFD